VSSEVLRAEAEAVGLGAICELAEDGVGASPGHELGVVLAALDREGAALRR